MCWSGRRMEASRIPLSAREWRRLAGAGSAVPGGESPDSLPRGDGADRHQHFLSCALGAAGEGSVSHVADRHGRGGVRSRQPALGESLRGGLGYLDAFSRATSSSGRLSSAICSGLSATARRLDPRIPRLAAQITGSASNSYDKAVAVERYLKTHYGYTLQLLRSPVADPLANFLFERKQGHCEYFASSMAVMLRTLRHSVARGERLPQR